MNLVVTARTLQLNDYYPLMSKEEIPRGSSDDEGFSFSKNNFDLIRLIAAGEVAFRHSMVHLAPTWFPYWLEALLAFIPGVPIFFFLSGYLISKAWERSLSATDYFRNRALRLFPALWMCTAASVVVLFALGYMFKVDWSPLILLLWVTCQGTCFQFWNPDFLRDFGVGAVNGSLWTISVEIQFYVVTAVLYTAFRRCSPNQFTSVLGVIAIGGAIVYSLSPQIVLTIARWPNGETLGKLFQVSFLPWFFMFLFGVIAQRTSRYLIPFLLKYAWQIIAIYIAAVSVGFLIWELPLGNNIPAYLIPIMGATVLVCGYLRPKVAGQVLRGNDISYGLYIYHMPVTNTILYLGAPSALIAPFISLALSITLAFMSWKWVERPWLRRKRNVVASARSSA